MLNWRQNTKRFASGFPVPNEERAASKRCDAPLRKLCREGDWEFAEGTSQVDFCCCLVGSPAADCLRLEFLGCIVSCPILGLLVRLGLLDLRTICTQPSKIGAEFHPTRGMTFRGLTVAKETTLHNLAHCLRLCYSDQKDFIHSPMMQHAHSSSLIVHDRSQGHFLLKLVFACTGQEGSLIF